MSPLGRIVLHLLLAVSLVIPGIIAPAQAITDGIRAIATESTAPSAAAEAMPCGGIDMSTSAEAPAACDCCTQHVCDLTACLGIACLPELPHLAAGASRTAEPPSWQPRHVPLGVIDTLLRPPIA